MGDKVKMVGMTVGDLMRELENLPVGTPVIMSKDAEGNGYSPLSNVTEAMYVPESTWSGQAYPTSEQINEEDSGYTDEDRAPSDAVRVVELGPVN